MERAPGRRVVVFYLTAGGGHRSAALALQATAVRTHPSLEVEIHDLGDVLAPLDPLRRSFGWRTDNAYNAMVRRGFTFGLVPLLRGFQGLVSLRQRALARCVSSFLETRKPAAVVSVLPNFNGVLRDAVRQSLPGVPFAVVLTDFADFPPNFWLVPGLDRAIVATEEARAQAATVGLPQTVVRRTSGMILNPNGHGAHPPGRVAARQCLGLDENAFVVLVLFGGKGAPEMAPLVARLMGLDPSWVVVAIAGDNPSLEARLRAQEVRWNGRLRVYGFTHEVGTLMTASDVLLTKPGPGSLAEAFHHRLVVVVPLNGFTIPQERFNARFVESRGLGVMVRSWREMADAALHLRFDADRIESMRRRMAALPENVATAETLAEIASLAGVASSMRDRGHDARRERRGARSVAYRKARSRE